LEQDNLNRHFGTTSERHILALEMIADKLALITEALSTLVPLSGSVHTTKTGRLDREEHENWENEGGHLVNEIIVPGFPQIKRISVEYFLVGKFRYTDLTQAKEQVRRQANRIQTGF